jgi:hypothetical protein
MSTNTPSGWGARGVGQRIEEAIELIEIELRHAIAYVNDAVIPQVRRESISAMRTAADTLRNLADRFEHQGNPAAGQARGAPQNPPQATSQTGPRDPAA